MAKAKDSKSRSKVETSGGPSHLRWMDYRRSIDWSLPQSETWGFHRGVHPHIEAADIKGQVVRIPSGQASPPHALGEDHVFVHLIGDIEFAIGERIYPFRQYDLLMLPSNTPHKYMNVGLTDAMFFDLWAKPRPGDVRKESRYFTHTPQHDFEGARPPVHMRWEDYRHTIRWQLRQGEIWGYHRGVHPDIEATDHTGHVVRIPSGQASPAHSVGRDLILLQLLGEVEFSIGGIIYPLAQYDLLLIPADTLYSYINPGLTYSMLITLQSKPRPGDAVTETRYVTT